MQAQSPRNRSSSAVPSTDGSLALSDWRSAHEWVVRLAKTQAGLDYEQAVALLAAFRTEVHRQLGFGSFHEYADRQMGYSPRQAYERLRVARALEDLPQLGAALRDGRTSWSVVRELTRVATAETEQEWLSASANKTVRAVEQLVSGHQPGSRPHDLPNEGARRQVLRFDVSADVAAMFREAVAQLGRQAGGHLADEDVLLALARIVLTGPSDPGRASYQIAMTVCERCRRGFQQACGAETEVAAEVVEMACCDAQHIGHEAEGRAGGGAHGGTGRRDRAEGRGTMESAEDAEAGSGTGKDTAPTAPHRATQSIPPATRRLVWRRDRGGCVVPGCENHRFCDVHHLNPRAEGGDHAPKRLVVLCGVHHRAVHDGRLVIDGQAPSGLAFRHADGTSYGARAAPLAPDIFAKVFKALRHLGYRETEVQRALGKVRAHVGVGSDVTDERVLREALSVLAA